MNCEEARMLLDAYVDGELTPAQERALMDHVNACESCRHEFDAALLLRDVLGNMDEEVAVPLEAQAAWRRAVRAEAKKKAMRKWTRFASAAAALVVVAFGLGFALKEDAPLHPSANQPQLLAMDNSAAVRAGTELIARDGETELAVALTADLQPEYNARKKYATERFDAACDTIEALAAEYSGSFRLEGEAVLGARELVYRVELPCDYMEDFLSAVSRIGTELDSQTMAPAGETAVLCIQIVELKAE